MKRLSRRVRGGNLQQAYSDKCTEVDLLSRELQNLTRRVSEAEDIAERAEQEARAQERRADEAERDVLTSKTESVRAILSNKNDISNVDLSEHLKMFAGQSIQGPCKQLGGGAQQPGVLSQPCCGADAGRAQHCRASANMSYLPGAEGGCGQHAQAV